MLAEPVSTGQQSESVPESDTISFHNDSANDGKDITPPPDSPYGWVVLVSGFFVLFLTNSVIGSFGIYQEEYTTTEFPDTSVTMISWIGTLSYAVTNLFGIVTGAIYERYDPHIPAVSGAVVAGTGLIIASFCDTPWKLLLTQGILFGIGNSFMAMPAISYPIQWFEKHCALATGLAFSGGDIGSLVFTFATRAMIKNLGRRWALRIHGILIAVICSILGLVLKPRIKAKKRDRIVDFNTLRDYRVIIMCLIGILSTGGYMVPSFYITSYATIELGKGKDWATKITSITSAMSIVGKIVVGFISDKFGPTNVFVVLMSGATICTFAVWLPSQTTAPFIVTVVVLGLTGGAIASILPSIIARLFGTERISNLLGFLFASLAIGGVALIPASSEIFEKYGHKKDFTELILFTGAMLTSVVVVVVILRFSIDRRLFAIV